MGGGLLAGLYAASPSTACLPAVSGIGGGLLAGLYAASPSTACVPAFLCVRSIGEGTG